MIKRIFFGIFLCLFAKNCFAGLSPDTTKKGISALSDISDFIGQPNNLRTFIDSNFVGVHYEGIENPIPFFRVDFTNKTDSLKFCAMPVQRCWLQRSDTFYSFFILIKRMADIKKNISSVYGSCDASALITAEGVYIHDSVFMWVGKIKIDLSPYYNISQNSKYDNCDLITVRNMTYKQLILASARQ